MMLFSVSKYNCNLSIVFILLIVLFLFNNFLVVATRFK
jgi:hypothetical protein